MKLKFERYLSNSKGLFTLSAALMRRLYCDWQVDGVWLLRDWFKYADTSVIGHDRINQFLVSDISSVEQVLH